MFTIVMFSKVNESLSVFQATVRELSQGGLIVRCTRIPINVCMIPLMLQCDQNRVFSKGEYILVGVSRHRARVTSRWNICVLRTNHGRCLYDWVDLRYDQNGVFFKGERIFT